MDSQQELLNGYRTMLKRLTETISDLLAGDEPDGIYTDPEHEHHSLWLMTELAEKFIAEDKDFPPALKQQEFTECSDKPDPQSFDDKTPF